jgi:hypothetical protein
MITTPIHDEQDAQMVATHETEGSMDPQSIAVSEPFVGQWNKLISQTNWEKGRIISEWRSALIESGAAAASFSDDAWSKRVGGVTSQHVGRLRRVFDRFGNSQSSYQGLYWTHFLAAIDWDDAELWLEGAVRSGWSISEMRKTRWESSGSDPKHAPRDEELITSESEEAFDALTRQADDVESDRSYEDGISTSKTYEDADFGDSDEGNLGSDAGAKSAVQSAEAGQPAMKNPFADLPQLPPDVFDAMEQFKLSIIRHRATQWSDVSQKAMLDAIEALRQFAMR